MEKRLSLFLSVVLFFVVFVANPAFAEDVLFSDLIDKGAEIFLGMRDIIYVVSGFGIIGVAIGGFFGNLNWKWLGAIIVGLMVLATTNAIIHYITDQEIAKVEDTLK